MCAIDLGKANADYCTVDITTTVTEVNGDNIANSASHGDVQFTTSM